MNSDMGSVPDPKICAVSIEMYNCSLQICGSRQTLHGLRVVAHSTRKRSIRIVGDRRKGGVWTLTVCIQRTVMSDIMRRMIFHRFLFT